MRQQSTAGLRRLQPIQKAARLLSEGRVRLVPRADVYLVAGDSGEYRVVASPEGIFCPCEARTPLCSHVLSVAQLRAQGNVVHLEEKPKLSIDELWKRVGA